MDKHDNHIDKLYSQTLVGFIKRLENLAKDILEREIGCIFRKDEFFFNYGAYSLNSGIYRLKLVAFEHPKRLGFFDSHFKEIGINKKFLKMSLEKFPNRMLLDLLRHEIAHYLTFIIHGKLVEHHGKEFHAVCQTYRWGPSVSAATTEESVEPLPMEGDEKSDKVLSKIHKLLALANSANPHEAEQAALKSHELLLKHNLSESSAEATDFPEETEHAVKRLFKEKRISAKSLAISSILRLFFVYPVTNRSDEHSYLEIFGTKSNVAIAEHVGHFLYREMDCLWEKTRQLNPFLKGSASKNSFYRGLAQGYCSKMNSQRKSFSAGEQYALTVLESNLSKQARVAYTNLVSSQRSSVRHCETASKMGQAEGRRMHIASSIPQSRGTASSEKLLLS